MTQFIADNKASREILLARVRKALGRTGSDAEARARADAYVAAHAHGPRPAMQDDLVQRFIQRAGDMASTVERIESLDEVPQRVASYIAALKLPERIAAQRSSTGVCWPEFARLDWAGAGLAIEPRPTLGHDRLAITGCYCAIAETGTLAFVSGADRPTSSALLPDTHVAVLRADRIVSGMEEAFALVRKEHATMPRAVNLISGPSRTGDIEQTIVLGAHGPYRVHILVL